MGNRVSFLKVSINEIYTPHSKLLTGVTESDSKRKTILTDSCTKNINILKVTGVYYVIYLPNHLSVINADVGIPHEYSHQHQSSLQMASFYGCTPNLGSLHPTDGQWGLPKVLAICLNSGQLWRKFPVGMDGNFLRMNPFIQSCFLLLHSTGVHPIRLSAFFSLSQSLFPRKSSLPQKLTNEVSIPSISH